PIQVLSRFRHPNLVMLMGFARLDRKGFLVYELLEGGDVFNLLHNRGNHRKEPISRLRRLSIALDASRGLSHLHSSSPRVFHRDIKTANILLDRNGTAKVSDFGLAFAARGDAEEGNMRASGTPAYADPEYLRTLVFSEGTEAYSFGIVLLELVTGKPPTRFPQQLN
ncbi:B-Raf proto-oncogene serine/threonine-protein kinase, putative, partial [Perkinsus marinus ATCC 50983]